MGGGGPAHADYTSPCTLRTWLALPAALAFSPRPQYGSSNAADSHGLRAAGGSLPPSALWRPRHMRLLLALVMLKTLPIILLPG